MGTVTAFRCKRKLLNRDLTDFFNFSTMAKLAVHFLFSVLFALQAISGAPPTEIDPPFRIQRIKRNLLTDLVQPHMEGTNTKKREMSEEEASRTFEALRPQIVQLLARLRHERQTLALDDTAKRNADTMISVYQGVLDGGPQLLRQLTG